MLNDDVIEYILSFLSCCELCNKADIHMIQCFSCKRYWCAPCLRVHVYIKRYFKQFVCLYCIRNERPIYSFSS